MGDPKKPKKQYKKPGHPWQADRIKEEVQLLKEYGLTNKQEIWRMNSMLRNWQRRARDIIGLPDEQAAEETKALIHKLTQLGIVDKSAQIDDVLALTVRDVLERRLQTQVYKLGLSNSIKQARQFIVHNKVFVNGQIISAPSHILKAADKVILNPNLTPILKKTVKLPKKEPAKSESKSEQETPKPEEPKPEAPVEPEAEPAAEVKNNG